MEFVCAFGLALILRSSCIMHKSNSTSFVDIKGYDSERRERMFPSRHRIARRFVCFVRMRLMVNERK